MDSLVPIQENQKIVTDENGVKFGLDSKMFVLEPIDSNGNVPTLKIIDFFKRQHFLGSVSLSETMPSANNMLLQSQFHITSSGQ